MACATEVASPPKSSAFYRRTVLPTDRCGLASAVVLLREVRMVQKGIRKWDIHYQLPFTPI